MWLKSSNDYDINVGMVLFGHTVFNAKNDLWTLNIVVFDTQNWQGPLCSTVTTFTFSYTFLSTFFLLLKLQRLHFVILNAAFTCQREVHNYWHYSLDQGFPNIFPCEDQS